MQPSARRIQSVGRDDALDDSARYHLYEFHSQILPDDRVVAVYLPPEFEQDSTRSFPVFYLHDGQNLFDGRTSYVAGKTWRAHITADELRSAGVVEPIILVGVANTGVRRMAEYTPTRDYRMGGGEGPAYARLLIEELKPFIDRTYRTLSTPRDTAVGGSSLGGLISLYLGLCHPDVFGKVAVMSPSLWWDHRSIFQYVDDAAPKPALKIWLDMGTSEGSRHLRDADLLRTKLLSKGWDLGVDLLYTRAAGAMHDEQAWADRFGAVLRFLFPAEATEQQ